MLCAACAAVLAFGMVGTAAVSADAPASPAAYAVSAADPTVECLSAQLVIIGVDGSETVVDANAEYTENGAVFSYEAKSIDLSKISAVDYIITASGLTDKGVTFNKSIGVMLPTGGMTSAYSEALIVPEEPTKRFNGPEGISAFAAKLPTSVVDCTVTMTIIDFAPVTIQKQSLAKAKVKAANKVYSGKALKPSVTVTLDGKPLNKGEDYTVSYKNNKNCGKATVTVTGKGYYEGKKSGSFIIKPAKAAAKKLASPKSGTLKLTWKKSAGGVDGYKVQLALDKKFKKSAKTYTVKKSATLFKTVKGMKKGKTYFARVCAYKKVGKTTYKGGWSAVKSVKCK